ncbi:hypothetical protein CVT24_002563 [Panaeolus cyanescens]|uniref:Uncharacterized protein n=1 Tax=Panaeolus cyanescens TaxID=181874 RepID=A0A409YTY4_9AGAR|nr:hypothetical protein CVT24_002563 [Panaeolus cyanescens]
MSQRTDIPQVNWSTDGSVIVSNGRIFVSPNSKRRDVNLPPEQPSLTSPFQYHKEKRITVHAFNRPVWWNNLWGWLGFMPLSPSFLSVPFQCLTWKPKVEEAQINTSKDGPEIRYRMVTDDLTTWTNTENSIIQACSVLRLAYKIPGEMPPRPSEFGYSAPLRSLNGFNSRATISRDWFVVWMGFLSYLICISQHPDYNRKYKAENGIPTWFKRLQQEGMGDKWLEGLVKSVVCDFDSSVPRNGVIFKLSESESNAVSVDWFLKHNIPIWFLFDSKEEKWIKNNRLLRNLAPPQAMVNDALRELFNGSSVMVKTIINLSYLN